MKLTYCISPEKIERTVLRVSDEIENNKKKKLNWKGLSEEQLWFELVSCMLGSRVRYETSKGCAEHLNTTGLLIISDLIENPRTARMRIDDKLSKPIYPPFSNGHGSKYPFSKSKSKFIVTTCESLYNDNSSGLKPILEIVSDEYSCREKLVELCMGIGPKQASLFLRNIGFSENLAILDSHVMRYMKILGLLEIETSISRYNYCELEGILHSHATSKGRSLSTLDFAIWIVMRVVKREFQLWA